VWELVAIRQQATEASSVVALTLRRTSTAKWRCNQ
jgi:hypothetical protein